MPIRTRSFWTLCVAAILIALISFSSPACRYRASPPVAVQPDEARIVGMTPDGNYIVTPAFIHWVWELKRENEKLRRGSLADPEPGGGR